MRLQELCIVLNCVVLLQSISTESSEKDDDMALPRPILKNGPDLSIGDFRDPYEISVDIGKLCYENQLAPVPTAIPQNPGGNTVEIPYEGSEVVEVPFDAQPYPVMLNSTAESSNFTVPVSLFPEEMVVIERKRLSPFRFGGFYVFQVLEDAGQILQLKHGVSLNSWEKVKPSFILLPMPTVKPPVTIIEPPRTKQLFWDESSEAYFMGSLEFTPDVAISLHLKQLNVTSVTPKMLGDLWQIMNADLGSQGRAEVSKGDIPMSLQQVLRNSIRDLLDQMNCSSAPCVNYFLPQFDFYMLTLSYVRDVNSKVLTFGFRNEGYKYVVYSYTRPSPLKGMKAFLEPIPAWGWITIGIAITGIVMVFRLSSSETDLHVSTISLWAYSVILEQDVDVYRFMNVKNFHLVALWIYTALLLRNIYNSSLYTYMAMDKSPEVPTSIEKLMLEYPHPKLHVSDALIHSYAVNDLSKSVKLGTESVSFMQAIMDKDLNIYSSYNCTISLCTELYRFARNMSRIAPGEEGKITCEYLQANISMDRVSFQTRQWKTTEFSVSDQFAVIMREANAPWIGYLLQEVLSFLGEGKTPRKIFRPQDDMETSPEALFPYVKDPWFAIYETMDSMLGRLVDSGIYGRHFFYMGRLKALRKIESMLDLIESQCREDDLHGNGMLEKIKNLREKRWNKYAILQSKRKDLEQAQFLTDGEETLEPGPMEDFLVAWVLFIASVVVSICAFVSELGWNSIIRNRNGS